MWECEYPPHVFLRASNSVGTSDEGWAIRPSDISSHAYLSDPSFSGVCARFQNYVIQDAYYDYYFYPRIKGAEYSYPEVRYTFGQAAIFLWSVVGLCTAALAGRCALFRKGANWMARSLIAFAVGFVLLVVGLIAGMAMRDFGF